MNLSEEGIFEIFQILAGVIHMMEMKFVSGKEMTIEGDEHVKAISLLYQIPEHLLTEALLKKTMVIKKEVIKRERKVEEIHLAVEALAKMLYKRLFDFVVTKINQ